MATQNDPNRRHCSFERGMVGCMIFLFLLPSAAAGSENLLSGAKNERQVVLYTAMVQRDTDIILRKFMEKYPFIQARYSYAPTDQLLAKVSTEFRTGKLQADVIQIGGVLAEVLKKQGVMGNYVSPELKAIPDDFKDPDGLWGSAYIQTNVIGYNTRFVNRRDIPKTYEELLEPKWKGKLGLARNEVKWFIARLGIMGEKKGLDFMRKLSKQEIKFFPTKTVVGVMLGAGEIDVAVNSLADGLEKEKAKGAPVEWIAVNPVHTTILPIFVAKGALNPNAAELLVDFVLSKEGQTVIKSFNRIPTRRDVLPDPPRLVQGLKFYPDQMDSVDRFEEFDKKFREIFLN
jgi:iron(III) transport system substrate-binding protein